MKNSNIKKNLTAIDLFGGCGGLSLGLSKAGFKVLAAVEILTHARETYSLNHKDALLFSDIKKISGSDIMEQAKLKPGDLDLLAGCPPCQGFSSLRRKNRLKPADDDRNELIFDFLRLIQELLPKTILMENVPALMKDQRMKKVRLQLKKLGYNFSIGVLNAADFGVPQRRKRMILIASRLGKINLPSSKINKKKTVRNAIGGLSHPEKSKNPLHKILSKHSDKIMKRICQIPIDGGSRNALGAKNQLNCHKRLVSSIGGGFNDVYGRLWWDKEASTITRFCTNPSKGRFLHPTQNRALTVYEAALLQSFPKSYKFPKDLGILKLSSMIGEALPPLFAKAQAIHIRKHLSDAT
ncbi:DNA cytosine methyltransferase [Leptospira santarosai]|uniref:DNA cytosine methyltransferase n=1 Tax=Leptospira santarosai TaxID=28183 RepID=UPI000773401F|nr:DNA cytosine methyltransferase [Leptospira santarosai]